MSLPGKVLYLGGTRSGKSTAAERRLQHLPTTYVATARDRPGDAEWEQRVAGHRARRPAHWRTVESRDLGSWVRRATPGRPVLVDCLTLWLTHLLDDLGAWSGSHDERRSAIGAAEQCIERLATQVAAASGGVVLVSNEVGSSVVPATTAGRLFADLMGRCNAAVAQECDEVNLMVAGCLVPIKTPQGAAT